MNKRRFYTTDEVRNILGDLEAGFSYSQVSKNWGRSKIALMNLVYSYNRYKRSGEFDGSRGEKMYRIFKKLERETPKSEEEKSGPVQEEEQPKQEDRYTGIETAFANLQTSIIDFIEDEATKRSEEKIKEFRDKYEAELEKMQSILVEAKESSIIGALRRSFGK